MGLRSSLINIAGTFFPSLKWRQEIRARWGKPGEDNAWGASAYFDLRRRQLDPAAVVDDKTWTDLEFPRFFTAIDTTITAIGRQHLFDQLRVHEYRNAEQERRSRTYEILRNRSEAAGRPPGGTEAAAGGCRIPHGRSAAGLGARAGSPPSSAAAVDADHRRWHRGGSGASHSGVAVSAAAAGQSRHYVQDRRKAVGGRGRPAVLRTTADRGEPDGTSGPGRQPLGAGPPRGGDSAAQETRPADIGTQAVQSAADRGTHRRAGPDCRCVLPGQAHSLFPHACQVLRAPR